MEELLDGQSINITAEKIEQLRTMFPEVFTEGKIDFRRLRDVLGDNVAFQNEHYELSWAGKGESRKEVQKQTASTLIADRENSIDFDNSENIFIEGENLEVLRVLQKSYFSKIKMIYIDPPYNTGNDSFVYPDDYSERQDEYKRRAGITDQEGFLNKQDLWKKNTKENGQFHSVWLSMMYPRLYLARNLLSEDGVIFVSIDDNEQSNLKLLMDEIFGEENFIAVCPWRKRTAKSDVPFGISQDYEWILCYTKGKFFAGKKANRSYYSSEDYNDRWRLSDLTKQSTKEERPKSFFTMVNPKNGKKYPANPNRVWAVSEDTFEQYYKKGKIVFPGDYDFLNIKIPAYRVFESEDKSKSLKKFGLEESIIAISTFLPSDVGRSEDGNKEIMEIFGAKVLAFPKPSSLIKYLMSTINEKDFYVLDFFAGSGTTGQATLELNAEDEGNRKFILIQYPEPIAENSETFQSGYKKISDICKTRISKICQKIKKAKAETLDFNSKKRDFGFRAYTLEESNFKIWKNDIIGDEILNQLALFSKGAVSTNDNENIVIELLLKLGLPLSEEVTEVKSASFSYYLISKRQIAILTESFDLCIDDLLINKIKKVICLDKIFNGNDNAKTNFSLMLKDEGISFTCL
jgi:adenine-specific DNA-methyltransferase